MSKYFKVSLARYACRGIIAESWGDGSEQGNRIVGY